MSITATNWLNDAKAGDKVALFRSGKGREVEISRVTASMVMVGSLRFRKNGDCVGNAHVGSLRPLDVLLADVTADAADERRHETIVANLNAWVTGR